MSKHKHVWQVDYVAGREAEYVCTCGAYKVMPAPRREKTQSWREERRKGKESKRGY